MHLTANPKIGALAALFVSCLLVTPSTRAEEPEVAVVVKIAGIPWFTAMEKGIKEAAKSPAFPGLPLWRKGSRRLPKRLG